jgi:hypothetical protein
LIGQKIMVSIEEWQDRQMVENKTDGREWEGGHFHFLEGEFWTTQPRKTPGGQTAGRFLYRQSGDDE